MAETRICSIPECHKTAVKRGWCTGHYKRWRRHGDPLAGRIPNGEAAEFLAKAIAYEGDECLIWPYAKSAQGYGRININGRSSVVSRVICEEAHGSPPTPLHEAAHSCGNGHRGCIAKRHLSWKTPTENNADKITHGTSNRGEQHPMVKLTETQVLAILMDGRVYRVIADEYGISPITVSDIKRGRSWAWMSD